MLQLPHGRTVMVNDGSRDIGKGIIRLFASAQT